MALIFKFPTNRKLYSDKFIKDIKPNAIGDFIRTQHPGLSVRAADAMALAIYYGYEKIRNTIRGQGTKVKRYKIPEMCK